MTTVAHATHAMVHTAHSVHAIEPRMGRSKARTVISSAHTVHLAAMALVHVAGTLAMNLLVVRVMGRRHGVA